MRPYRQLTEDVEVLLGALEYDGLDVDEAKAYLRLRTALETEAEIKVLTGRVYANLSSTWREQAATFDDTCQQITTRRADQKVSDAPDEIIEVAVLRRARVTGEVRVEEVP